MLQFKGFNDYMVEVYYDGVFRGKFTAVSNLYFLVLWLGIHPYYRKWTTIRVYHRLSETFIGEYSRNGDIPSKPQI